jgi:hypothetical protein
MGRHEVQSKHKPLRVADHDIGRLEGLHGIDNALPCFIDGEHLQSCRAGRRGSTTKD